MAMVANYGRYFGGPFKFLCVMTQVYPLSPIIFNVVVDAVLQNWVTVVTASEGTEAPDIEGFGHYIQRMAAYLYDDDRILASTQKHDYSRC